MKSWAVIMFVVLALDGPLLPDTRAPARQVRSNLNDRDARGVTALEEAVLQGNTSSVVALIEAGADVNVRDNRAELLYFGRRNTARLRLFEP